MCIGERIDNMLCLDDFSFKLSAAVENLHAVHHAMTEGAFAPEEFFDALYSSYLMLHSLQKELRCAVEVACKEVEKECANEKDY